MARKSRTGNLILSRDPGQKITLQTSDGMIEITYLDHRRGNQIALGIRAPRSVEIMRDNTVDRERRAGTPEPENPPVPLYTTEEKTHAPKLAGWVRSPNGEVEVSRPIREPFSLAADYRILERNEAGETTRLRLTGVFIRRP